MTYGWIFYIPNEKEVYGIADVLIPHNSNA
jgi:hypothetical protein